MQYKKEPQPICPYCSSKNTIKRGKRKRKLRIIQQFQCKDCQKFFSPQTQNSKTYPLNIILKAISIYNIGYNLNQTSEKLMNKYKIKVPISTLSEWLSQYKNICTFARLRKEAIKHYKPTQIIQKQTLNHIQPYTFQYHKVKLDITLKENPRFSKLREYIEKIHSKEFPHHIFTYNKSGDTNDQRASQAKFNYLRIKHIQKQNQANELAKLALNLANSNKERHKVIQDFMLINDSTTIAVEIPIYLTNWDAGYYRNQKGFIFPLNNYKTPITGHIDLLQVRNGSIHILDYKPDADKIHP